MQKEEKKPPALKCPPRKTGKFKGSPFVFTIEDGTEAGRECNSAELEGLTGMHRATFMHKLRIGYKYNDPMLFVLEGKGTPRVRPEYVGTDNHLRVMRSRRHEICPLMFGATNLRTLEEGFWASCKKMRAKRRSINNTEDQTKLFCHKCKGKIVPDGVVFISKEEHAAICAEILGRR